MKKVSIITVTYNSQNTLQRTIDSVKQQDYDNIEHIIVDGSSIDNTLSIIKHNKSVEKYISEPDKGIYQAINKGIRMATGDIIGILNSDDVLATHDIITKIVDFLNENEADVVYGNLLYVSADKLHKSIRYWKSNVFNPGCLKYGWMAPHPTIYCKRSVYEKYGLYNEDLQISSDYDFILRVFSQNELKKSYLPIVMIKMSWGGKSNGSIANLIRKSKEDLKVIKSNNIGGLFTLLLKNTRKIKQFL